MNALSLYVTTTRMLLQANIDDSGAWNDINRLMSYLRQSLTCCVCGKLIHIPMSSTVSSCQHHVCKSCVGGKMRLKPSCSWCKDHSKFIENIQLRILLQCYKQLTSFVLSSPIVTKWGSLACESNQASYSSVPNNLINGPSTFKSLLEEGSNFQDKFNFSEPPPLKSFNRQANGHHSQQQQQQQKIAPNVNQEKNNDEFTFHGISGKNETTNDDMVKNNSILMSDTSQGAISSSNSLVSGGTPPTSSNSANRKVRRGCRCGLATPNPGKLTCCGQRCPCYVENKACQQCKCRGCRNPNRVSNLTTINIISSGSSSSSPIISIPSSSLFQIPILVGDEEESSELGENQVFITTSNISIGTEDETLCEEIKTCSNDDVTTEVDGSLL